MNPARIIIIIAVAFVLGGLFFILRTNLSSNESVSDTNTPRIVNIKIKDGKPVGGVKTVEVAKNQKLSINAVADTTDTLHIHGYDRTLELQPNVRGTINFTANLAGTFDVELHGSDEKVLVLVVQP